MQPFKKGQLLFVKAPPYYKQEYPYLITSAGEKIVYATLYRSDKVKKRWTTEELLLLIKMEVVRIGKEDDL